MTKTGILALPVALALMCSVASAHAQEHKVLYSTYRLNIVENPGEFSRWWNNVIDTQEGRAAANTVAAFFDCIGCGTAIIEGVNSLNIVEQRHEGNEHVGYLQSPSGYRLCKSWVVDPSLNCNGTFTGRYRSAADPGGGHVDGLHYYLVVPAPREGGGRCWVDGLVNMAFIEDKPDNPLAADCLQSVSIAFHYGK